MSAHHPPVPGTSNAGPATHTTGRKHNPTVSYDMEGLVRWYDDDAASACVVVHVDTANSHAGRFLDQDVTFTLSDADTPAGALPGARVRIRARMERDLGLHAPDPVAASSIAVLD